MTEIVNCGRYILEKTQSENTRTFLEVTKPLWNVAITDTETDETIEINDIVSPYAREDWCATVFKNAKEGLDSEEGPSCCYVNAQYRL